MPRMGFEEAEQCWERWQLRVLVLGSLALQFFLIVAAALRRRRVPPWFRFLTWAVYQGSDALAIYALAILFNRRRRQDPAMSSPAAPSLEALWAPILLLHLGGQDGITAYSIQDSELWPRHFVIAASQIVVAIYVFRKSWPRGDKSLLQAAVLLFIPGVLKCLEKPIALRRASISSMAVTVGSKTCKTDYFDDDDDPALMEEEDKPMTLKDFVEQASKVCGSVIENNNNNNKKPRPRVAADNHRVKESPYRLLVDIPYPLSIRLANLKYMSKKGDVAHRRVRSNLSKAFNRLYTNYKGYPGAVFRAVLVVLTFVAIRLFNRRRGAYDAADLTVTYVLLSCTAALECVSTVTMARCRMMSEPPWPDEVGQCDLLRYVAHGKEHGMLRSLASWLGCEGYLDRFWCTGYLNRPWCTAGWHDRLWWCAGPSRGRPALPSPDGITSLIHDHITEQWTKIKDAADYRSFSESRGQWTIGNVEDCSIKKNCLIASSLQRPFDESVVVWHLATEFCYLGRVGDGCKENRRCREISNYMVYLLLVNPEMLMPGARCSIFWMAYKQVMDMLALPGEEEDTKTDDNRKDKEEKEKKKKKKKKKTTKKLPYGVKEDIARMIIYKVSSGDSGTQQQTMKPAPEDNSNNTDDSAKKGSSRLVQDAWDLAVELRKLVGEDKEIGEDREMWRVIRGVWVEMLCFSAGRCTGYLHAKSLGTGTQYLSYVWLLREYMGMEPLADTMQRLDDSIKTAGN